MFIVRVSGGHGFPFVASSVKLQVTIKLITHAKAVYLNQYIYIYIKNLQFRGRNIGESQSGSFDLFFEVERSLSFEVMEDGTAHNAVVVQNV